MRRRRQVQRPLRLTALLVAFCIGALVDWLLHEYGPPMPVDAPAIIASPEAPAPATTMKPPDVRPGPATPKLAPTTGTTSLRIPVDNVDVESFRGSFQERRGSRMHEAVDILAPRNTPVHAAVSGTIAKLFFSKQGGNTVYEFDQTGHFCYYYAHLERYAEGLQDGQPVSQGQVIGYVGTSGNAPPNTPHLHLAVFELDADRRWWKGRPIDPYLVFSGKG